MKALCKQTMGFILMTLLACGVTSIKAQDSADDEFITVSGVVKRQANTKKTGIRKYLYSGNQRGNDHQ